MLYQLTVNDLNCVHQAIGDELEALDALSVNC